MGKGKDNPGKALYVTEDFCTERTLRIEQAIKGVESAVKDLKAGVNLVLVQHADKLGAQQTAVDRHGEALKALREVKEMSHKKTVIYVAVVAVGVSFLSNIDKILAGITRLLK